MESTGTEGRRGRLAGGIAGWTRAEWRSLAVAIVISLATHVLLLSAKGPPREGDGRAPMLVVRLVEPRVSPPTAPVAPRAPEPVRAEREPPHRESPPPPPAVVPPQAPTPAPAAARVVPRRPAPEPPPPSAAPPPAQPRTTEAEGPPDQLASPVSTPELGDVPRRIVGRRLQATLSIDADGVVREAFVKRNEISEEVARSLEQALKAARFAPARREGRAIRSILETRLCFDSDGVLDTSSPECLRPEPAGGGTEASPAADGSLPPPSR